MNKTHIPIRELDAPATMRGFAAQHSLRVSGSTELTNNEKSILRKQITDFDALPSARQSAADLASIIEQEERSEIKISTKDITLHDDMKFSFGETNHGISGGGFKSLARAIGPQGAASYLAGVTPELRAHNLRELLKSPRPLKVRVRNAANNTGREIFAITDASYPDVYANAVLRRIAAKASPDARAEWTYDANTTRVSFKELMRSEISLDSFKHSADDVFQIGRAWGIRDDGASSVSMNLLTFRQLCSNMTILAADTYLKRVRHRGEGEAILGRIDKLFEQTAGFAKLFSEKWAGARATKWNSDPTLDAAITAYGMLISKRILKPIGDRDLFAAHLATNWLEEPGDSVADLLNGITRYARTLSITNSHSFGGSELEQSAGRLLTLPASTWDATRRI